MDDVVHSLVIIFQSEQSQGVGVHVNQIIHIKFKDGGSLKWSIRTEANQ